MLLKKVEEIHLQMVDLQPAFTSTASDDIQVRPGRIKPLSLLAMPVLGGPSFRSGRGTHRGVVQRLADHGPEEQPGMSALLTTNDIYPKGKDENLNTTTTEAALRARC